MMLAKNRKFADSSLEEAVTSEPVSAGKFRWRGRLKQRLVGPG
jgi:hypothetical protein